jgi:hypothetical protein
MKANVGGIDKALRAIVGLAIIGAGVYFQSWWGAVGIVPLLTAAFSFCPAYPIFGISTCCATKTEEPKLVS